MGRNRVVGACHRPLSPTLSLNLSRDLPIPRHWGHRFKGSYCERATIEEAIVENQLHIQYGMRNKRLAMAIHLPDAASH